MQYIILSRAKVLYVPKWTPLEISHFGFMGYPWVYKRSFESVKMGVGVSFTSNSIAHSKNSYVLVKLNVIILVFLNLIHFDIYKYNLSVLLTTL